jgi:hypothetical protein
MQALGFDTRPVRSRSGNLIVMIDPEAAKLVFDRLLTQAGVHLQLHTLLAGVERHGEQIQSITVADHRGLRKITATAFVDASGEATLATLAGVPMSQPGGPGAQLQPASLPIRLDGIGPNAVLDRDLLRRLIAEHNQSASAQISRADGGVLMELPAAGNFWSMAVDIATDGITAADLSRAEVSARQSAWDFVRLLRQVPGYERAHITATGPQLGIRETRRPRSHHDVTSQAAGSGQRSNDGIARGSWPMEIHEAPGRARFINIGGEGFFDIPHGAVQALGTSNLRLGGRVIGSDPQAYGSVRVMGTGFATGQAAGVSAALLADTGASDTPEVRRLLVQQGAIV